MPRIVDGKRVQPTRKKSESPNRQDSRLKDAQSLLSRLRAAPETKPEESQYQQDPEKLTRKAELEPIQVSAKPTSSLFDSLQFQKQEQEEPEKPKSSLMDYLAVGATPVLAGFLSGNVEGGYGAAAKGVAGLEARRTQQGKEELARQAELEKERLKQDRLKKSETSLVRDPQTGKIVRVPVSQAIGKEAAPSPGTESFEQKKEMKLFEHQLDARMEQLKQQMEQTGPDFKKERKLRKDLESVEPVEELFKIQGFVSNIKQIEENPIPEGSKKSRGGQDLNLLFSYMKILDPGSVVREGEQILARKSGAIPDRAYFFLDKLKEGKLLPEDVRESFIEEAKRAYEARVNNTVKPVIDRYQSIADRYGINKDAITPRFMSWDEAGVDTSTQNKSGFEDMSDDELEQEIQRLRSETE